VAPRDPVPWYLFCCGGPWNMAYSTSPPESGNPGPSVVLPAGSFASPPQCTCRLRGPNAARPLPAARGRDRRASRSITDRPPHGFSATTPGNRIVSVGGSRTRSGVPTREPCLVAARPFGTTQPASSAICSAVVIDESPQRLAPAGVRPRPGDGEGRLCQLWRHSSQRSSPQKREMARLRHEGVCTLAVEPSRRRAYGRGCPQRSGRRPVSRRREEEKEGAAVDHHH